jgi:hypothetical protein
MSNPSYERTLIKMDGKKVTFETFAEVVKFFGVTEPSDIRRGKYFVINDIRYFVWLISHNLSAGRKCVAHEIILY